MEREAAAVTRVKHPGIARVLEFVRDGERAFLVIERVDGADISVVVRDHGAMSAERVQALGSEVAGALAAAHANGVLHRDVKPQNVLLDTEGHARLTDFGSAWIEGQTTLTQTGAFVGTPDFVAPEVVGGRRADARADVYSLGLTLYYALVGQLPDRESPHLPVRPLAEGFRPRLKSPGVPAWLDDVVGCATASDPRDRYPTASTLGEALRAGSAGTIPSVRAGASSLLSSPSCRVCQRPSRLGLDVCPSCVSGGITKQDVLVVASPPDFPGGWKPVGAALARLLGLSPHAETVRDVAMGRKALTRLAAGDVTRVMRHLGARGIPVRAVPFRRSWTVIPRVYWAFLILTFSVGLASASIIHGSLPWVTWIVCSFLALAAVAWSRRPLVDARPDRAWLSPAAHRQLTETLSTLVPGAARDLLLDIAGTARTLSTMSRREEGAIDVSSETAALVDACSTSAAEVQRLDDTMARLERHAGNSREHDTALSRCTGARNVLVQQMLEALATLGVSHAEAAFSSKSAGKMLEDRVIELKRELDVQLKIARELDELSAP